LSDLDWDEHYRTGEVFWDKGRPSPPLQEYLQLHPVHGRTLVPGCGHGHEVALAVEQGLDATGLDIAPTAVAEARALYAQIANRFLNGNFFDLPPALRGAFDVVLEHTLLCALPLAMRQDYRRAVDLALKRGGLLVGVWFMDPALDPGEEGPPFGISVEELTALFEDGYEIVDDYIPNVAFPNREGRERLRVLRRIG
jgi:SAM-dependent methyltransferase